MTTTPPPADQPVRARGVRASRARGPVWFRRPTVMVSLVLHAIALGVIWFVAREPAVEPIPVAMLSHWNISEPALPAEESLDELLDIEEPTFDVPDVVLDESDEPSLDEMHEIFDPVSEPEATTQYDSTVVLSNAVFRSKRKHVAPASAQAPTPAQRTEPRPKQRRALTLVARPNVRHYYPGPARDQGLEGEAIVLIRIDVNGHVVDAKLRRSTGHTILDDAALKVAYAFVFSTGVAGRAELPIRFSLIG